MGRGSARLLLVGASAVLGVLVPATAAARGGGSPGPVTEPVRAIVTADGLAADLAPGWGVTHPITGVYRVRGPRSAAVDVSRWDAVADLVIVPLGRGETEIRFSIAGRPVDTAFSVEAVAGR